MLPCMDEQPDIRVASRSAHRKLGLGVGLEQTLVSLCWTLRLHGLLGLKPSRVRDVRVPVRYIN